MSLSDRDRAGAFETFSVAKSLPILPSTASERARVFYSFAVVDSFEPLLLTATDWTETFETIESCQRVSKFTVRQQSNFSKIDLDCSYDRR
jgi:hypothetical protein